MGVLAGALVPLFFPTGPPTAAAAAAARDEGPGPAMVTSHSQRVESLACIGDLDGSARPPVLLIPGTGQSPEKNWGPTYLPVLRERGHSVCSVRLPVNGTRDVQANAEYVATAIRTMARRTSRPISTIGHSQGALLPMAALRTWPDLAAHVDDVIGLAGVYDLGSQDLEERCEARCVPVLHQLAAGSAYLRAIARRPLPAGPSFTNIAAFGDETVTPQPFANLQPGATSMTVQSVCPRHQIPAPEHAMIIGDAVALALTLDALDHPGPAAPGRIDPATCAERQYPEFDLLAFLGEALGPRPKVADPVAKEPALYCRHRPDCRKPRLRGFVLGQPRITVGRQRVTLRATVELPGRARLRLGGRKVVATVQPGPLVLTIARPARRARLFVETRPTYYTAWAAEARRWVSAAR